MYRLSRRDIENLISVAITTAPKVIVQRSRSRDQVLVDWSTTAMIEHICNKIDNDSAMVIVADMVGFNAGQRRGKWGVDEPVPAVVPELG